MQEEYRIESEERLVRDWEKHHVTTADIETYLGHPLAAITPEEQRSLEEELDRADKHSATRGKPVKWILRHRPQEAPPRG